MKRPFIIGIGGTCSNAGKTTTAVLLLKYLTQARSGQQATETGTDNVLSSFTGPGKWGAIKYTKTEFYASLVDDKEALSRKDKDTGRFIESGAEEVVWVKSPPQGLEDVLLPALERLSSLDGIIVEGNSAIEFLQPDIVIFIFGNDKELWKPGTERLAGTADIIIYENESELPEVAKTKRLFWGDRTGIKGARGFLELISEMIHERTTERRNNEKGR